MGITRLDSSNLFCVDLLHHAEPPELTLFTVEVPMVIVISADETVAADTVVGFDAFDDLDWKR
jgi:hypothetical protein